MGCKFFFVLFFVGGVLFYVNYMFNLVFMFFDVNFLLIGVFIFGLFGGFVIIFFGVFFYILDIMDKLECILCIVVLEFMIFLGVIIGYLISGVLVDYGGFMVVFGFCLVVSVFVLIYVYFVLLELYFLLENYERNWVLVVVYNYFIVLF